MLKEIVERIVSEQHQKKSIFPVSHYYPVDLCLTNGNIVLRAFRIIEFKNNEITGITWTEEYSAPRENREPVLCRFKLEDIAWLTCFDLALEYQAFEHSASKS